MRAEAEKHAKENDVDWFSEKFTDDIGSSMGISAQRDEKFHSTWGKPNRRLRLRHLRAPNSRPSASPGIWESALASPSNIIINT